MRKPTIRLCYRDELFAVAMGHRAPSGSYQELGHIKTPLPCPERRFGASKPSGLQALAGHEVSRLGALLGVRGTGRSGNGSGKWQHRDGSCSSCVPTHGRNRLAAAMLHQRLDRAHYQWAQAESSTGQPRSLQACSAWPFARIPGPFTRCLLC